MKVFSATHRHGFCRITLFGITLFERDSVSYADEVHQKILGGLFSSSKKSLSSGLREKRFCLLGLPLFQRQEGTPGRELSVLGLTIVRKTWADLLSKSSLLRLSNDSDQIFIFKANSGEIFLFLRFLLPLILKKIPEARPLLVATKRYHLDMVNIICPDIPCILTKEKILFRLPSATYEVQGKKFHVVFPAEHFRSIEEKAIGDTPEHYFNRAAQFFNLNAESPDQFHVSIPSNIEHAVLDKVSAISLNLEKFVFLSPEARSCRCLSDDFWIRLAEAFQAKGFDIFINALQVTGLTSKIGKSCQLTFPEAFALARRAKRIVSLRSGLTEFLMDAQVPLDAIYTDFERRGSLTQVSATAVYKAFTLSLVPNFDSSRVREFIYHPHCEQKLLRDILQ